MFAHAVFVAVIRSGNNRMSAEVNLSVAGAGRITRILSAYHLQLGNFGNGPILGMCMLFRMRADFINSADDSRFEIGHAAIEAMDHRHIFDDNRLASLTVKFIASDFACCLNAAPDC